MTVIAEAPRGCGGSRGGPERGRASGTVRRQTRRLNRPAPLRTRTPDLAIVWVSFLGFAAQKR